MAWAPCSLALGMEIQEFMHQAQVIRRAQFASSDSTAHRTFAQAFALVDPCIIALVLPPRSLV